ncbi:hypothetical protein M758_UG280300 [Ceratodon purpureus]|nr:hypothetical protein M758_UG280300 [Ceratodon purpureus]
MAVEDYDGVILRADCSSTISKLIKLVLNYKEMMASMEQSRMEEDERLFDGSDNKGSLIVRFSRQAILPVEPVKLEAEEAKADSKPPRNMVQAFRDKPGVLFLLASRLMDFEPSEHLPVQFNGQLGPTTMQMLHNIHAWTTVFHMSPQAEAFACGTYGKRLEARSVPSSNLSEEAGLLDLQSSMQALGGEPGSSHSSTFRETT